MRAEARRKLEIPDAAEVLLHFGRDWRLKGGDLFLDAVGRLVSAGRPTFALINQGGAEAKSAAEARGLASRVRIVGLTTEPNELFHAADLVVSSSIGETMPYAVIEALASGLPVVASELAGHDYVADRIDNCVTVPSDPVALADAATRFLDRDPATARREGEAAREWVSEDLDVGRAAERLVDRYEVDLGSRPPAALDEARRRDGGATLRAGGGRACAFRRNPRLALAPRPGAR
jgi:glycosyltransferase involved in cell wall biosynthesis